MDVAQHVHSVSHDTKVSVSVQNTIHKERPLRVKQSIVLSDHSYQLWRGKTMEDVFNIVLC